MHQPIDQKTVDERIHRFMVSKSPFRALSKVVTDRFIAPVFRNRTSKSGITYESIGWTSNTTSHSH
jgi:hypothetical protein